MLDVQVASPARFIDHTLLKPDCSAGEVITLCEEAVEYGFAAVCVPPAFVSQAQKNLYGSGVNTCTVIGFPFGYHASRVKAFEAAHAVEMGASELDMVIQLGAARLLEYARVEEDICRVVGASGDALVKVIIECCLFDNDQKQKLTEIVINAGADFVKTSTGFSSGGATVEDVRLLSDAASGRIQVKASAGIRDWHTCQEMLAAGATRIGTSSGVAIMQQWQRAEGLI